MTHLAEVFRALNKLEHEGIIQKYAIAGATAFLFYTEPVRTYDLDVFIFLPSQDSFIVSLEPLYNDLRKLGYTFDAEHVMMYDTPVQFLPAYNELAEESVEEAIEHDYDGIPVRVISPEYLIALAFQTGGKHRQVRAEVLLEEDIIDRQKLASILLAHNIKLNIDGNTNV